MKHLGSIIAIAVITLATCWAYNRFSSSTVSALGDPAQSS